MKQSNKKIDKETLINSLLNLRKELSESDDSKSREIVFKINSCLYGTYPHIYETEK